MNKISIIIPIYGVEKYIERCARSLFEQTLDDIEYIFVNDCTKDKSIDILENIIEQYPQRKNQIKILHHEINKGLPQARRTGILAATGDYIAHCDSDDWVDHNMYRLMYEKAIETSSEIVICDYYNSSEGNNQHVTACYNSEKRQMIKDLCTMRISWSVWNKLIKSNLYQDSALVFPEGNMGEDMALIMQLVLKASKYAYIPTPLYYYFYNPQSITQSFSEEQVYKKFTQLKGNAEIILSVFDRYGLTQQYDKELSYVKWEVRRCIWPITKSKKYYNIWQGTYPEIFPTLLFSGYLSIREECKILLTYLRVFPR